MSATDSPETTRTDGGPAERPVATRAPGAPPAAAPASGRATAALILGILSIPACLIPILGVILGVIGLILGITARSDMRRNGVAVPGRVKAAIVLASIGIGLSVVLWILSAAAIISSNNN
jgi:thiol:disulfide interchange protein